MLWHRQVIFESEGDKLSTRHFPAAWPLAAKRWTVALVLFTVTSSQGHVNQVFTIMTLPHSPNSEIFIAPEQYIFHKDDEHR